MEILDKKSNRMSRANSGLVTNVTEIILKFLYNKENIVK